MPPISGYLSTLPTDVLLGSLVVYIDGTAAYGATSGDPTVQIKPTYENLPFDGKLLPMVGLDRKIDGVPIISGSFIEMNVALGLSHEPGGTTSTTSSVTRITPAGYGDFLAAGAYATNVRAVFRRGGGGLVAIRMPFALVIPDTFSGASAGNGSLSLTIEGRQDSAAAIGTPLYQIEFAASLSAMTALDP